MTSLIIPNDGTSANVSPTLVLGYEASLESKNVVHDIIGGGIGVTLIRPRPRSGTLALFFTEESAAFAAVELHKRETSFTLSDTDRPVVGMRYIVDGSVGIRLTDDRKRWEVSIDFQEVEA
ncbi:hypothetical protein [Microbacterium sp. NPDC091662]|uniref:hypothetical protein n=1 Tax=Microbacterium sp. NPDC091662 TaxID=3364211 RepID=UPI00382C62ED